MNYDEAATEAKRMIESSADWAEPKERPDKPGEYYVVGEFSVCDDDAPPGGWPEPASPEEFERIMNNPQTWEMIDDIASKLSGRKP